MGKNKKEGEGNEKKTLVASSGSRFSKKVEVDLSAFFYSVFFSLSLSLCNPFAFPTLHYTTPP